MITILLDSSNINLSVGIAKDNVLLDYVSYEAWQRQSEYMIPELNKLLTKHSISNKDIKEIIVAIGPGSYTGVRIAITIAKTIATALDVTLYPVSSLRVLKDNDKPSICLVNARGNRSYIGVYQGSKTLLEDQIMGNDDVLKYIVDHPSYSVCGETKYLSISGISTNTLEQMLSSKAVLKAINPLSLKPVYMKEEYAKPIY